jgi:hypothetical protein
VWLERQGDRISTHDLFGTGFVLLAASGASAWCDAAQHAARESGVALEVHRVGDDLHDPDSRFPGAHGLSETGMVIVRPDGFVGMRATDTSAGGSVAGTHAITEALAALTGRAGV